MAAGRQRTLSLEDIPTPTYRRERVLLETTHHQITGSLTLPNDSYRSRLFDLLNMPDRWFFALTDVTVTSREGGETSEHQFLAIARAQIVWLVNLDEPEDI